MRQSGSKVRPLLADSVEKLVVEAVMLSRFSRSEHPDPALPDFLFSSGVSVHSCGYFHSSYGDFLDSRRSCPQDFRHASQVLCRRGEQELILSAGHAS